MRLPPWQWQCQATGWPATVLTKVLMLLQAHMLGAKGPRPRQRALQRLSSLGGGGSGPATTRWRGGCG